MLVYLITHSKSSSILGGASHTVLILLTTSTRDQGPLYKDSIKSTDYRGPTVPAMALNPTAETLAMHTRLPRVRETRRKQSTAGPSSESTGTSTRSTQSACTTREHARSRAESARKTRSSQNEGDREDSDDDDGEDTSGPSRDDGQLGVAASARRLACPYSKYDPLEHVYCRMTKYKGIDSVRNVSALPLRVRHLLRA